MNQRSAWDEMAIIKQDLEAENEVLRAKLSLEEGRGMDTDAMYGKMSDGGNAQGNVRILNEKLNEERERRAELEEEVMGMRRDMDDSGMSVHLQNRNRQLEAEMMRAREDMDEMRRQLHRRNESYNSNSLDRSMERGKTDSQSVSQPNRR